jgi:hypothetical protein
MDAITDEERFSVSPQQISVEDVPEDSVGLLRVIGW